MGKHTTESQKVEFLTRCKYELVNKAAKKCIARSIAKDIYVRAGNRLVNAAIAFIPAPTLIEQAARKEGSSGH